MLSLLPFRGMNEPSVFFGWYFHKADSFSVVFLLFCSLFFVLWWWGVEVKWGGGEWC